MEDKRLLYADKITLERIELLHPKIRTEVRDLYLTLNMRLPKYVRLRFSHTLRTNKEQAALYAQGRTTKGKIVTNAKEGQSIHNYGLAFDIVILLDKDKNGSFETASWDLDANFMTAVAFLKSHGYTWGGSWTSLKDNPHFEKTFGHTWKTLINKQKDSKGYPII